MQPSGLRPRSNLIGREAQIELIERLLPELAGSGEGAIVTISGEPGIGKSRLLEECAHRAEEAGVVPLIGSCSFSGGVPYEPWRQVIEQYVDHFGKAEVSDRLNRAVMDLHPLLPSALGYDSNTADHGHTVRRYEMNEALAVLLSSHRTDSPLLVGIDDIHRASRHTLEALLLMGRRVAHAAVLLVLTYRSTAELATIAPVLDGFSRSSEFHSMLLEGLSQSECRSVLELTSGSAITEEIVRSVTLRTGGNPLYVQEIGRGLQIGSPVPARGTDSIRAIVLSRMAELSRATEAVVRTVAALGDEVELRTLQSSLPLFSGLQISQMIEEAVQQHLLVPAGATGRYRFRHEILRDAVLSAMRQSEVAEILMRVVMAHEPDSAALGVTEITRIASYCLRAVDVLNANVVARWVTRAARLSLSNYAPDGAAELIDPLLACDSRGTIRLAKRTRGDLLKIRARAAYELDQEDDQIRYLIEAFETYESAGLVQEAMEVALTPAYEYIDPHSEAVWIRGHRGVAALRVRAERLAAPNSPAHVRLLAQRGDRGSLEKALRISESLDDDATQLSVLRRFAYYAALDWDFSASASLNDRAREIALRLGDADASFWILYTDAMLSTLTGTHRDGARVTTELIEIAEALRLNKLRSVAHRCRAQVDAMEGRFHDALRGIDLALNYTTPGDDSFNDRMLAVERGLILAETEGVPDASLRTTSLIDRVYLALSTSDRTMWRAIHASADSGAHAGPPLTFRSGSIGVQACAVLELEREDLAEELLVRLQPFAGSFLGFYAGYFGVPADVQIGRLQILLGDIVGGSSSIEQGLELCRRAGRRPALAWSLLEYARALQRDRSTSRDRIADLATHSLDIACRMGMRTLETLSRDLVEA
ncbi:MAG: ATP-binding protein, partial [Spirochaetota bacterium]